MNENDLLISEYDWTDSWLIKINHEPNSIIIQLDARNIVNVENENTSYNNIKLNFLLVKKIQYDFSINHRTDDEICAVDFLEIKHTHGAVELNLELEYGKIFVEAEELKLTTM